jgi:hypothetical protein
MPAATTSVSGYLTSTDWTTFNNKSNTNGTVTSVAALTLGTTGTDLSSTVATGTSTPVITLQVPTASAANRGALSSTDWTTFNNKQPAGSYLVSGGALGTPSSGTVTNLTGTASININGTVGATTPTTGAFTTMQASTGAAVGGATPGSGGLAFPATAVAVADVNTLDDYEEGTWTPNQGVGLTVVGTFSSSGHYVKVGNLVTARGQVNGSTTIAAAAGTDICTNFPFAPVAPYLGAVMDGNAVNSSIGFLYGAGRFYSINAIAASPNVFFSISYTI